ncbi:hypothetical protein N334_01172, partial [Pelecanus crispus]
TQTELPHKHAAVQISSCRECLRLSLVPEGSGDGRCLWCDQVDDLLSLVAELKEEVERLRSIRECEREIDWWSRTRPSLGPGQRMEAPQGVEDPLPSCQQAEGGDLRDGGEWKQVPAQGGRQIPSWPPSPSQLPLHNRYGALEVEGQASGEGGEGEGPARGLPRANQSAPQITTALVKKKRRVIVVGDSLLWETEGPICRPDPSHREVCCLPGAQVRDITKKLPDLVRPSNYYPLLVVQVGSDEITERSPKAIKRDFRALGQLVAGSGAQIVFSSILSMAGKNAERNRKTHLINKGLGGWCCQWNFGFLDHGEVYTAPGLLAADGDQLSPKGKRILTHELAGLIERALN